MKAIVFAAGSGQRLLHTFPAPSDDDQNSFEASFSQTGDDGLDHTAAMPRQKHLG